METLLQVGDALQLERQSTTCIVDAFVGGGGQGEVYRVHVPERNEHYALKWYFPSWATREQFERLQRLVNRGVADPRFLWPLDIAVKRGVSEFGYLMHLRSSSFVGIVDLMRGTVSASLRVLTTSAFHLADSFENLHIAGYCYGDISFGHFFFDPRNGDVLVLDNDQVRFLDDGPAAGMRGTLRFMAPEVMLGKTRPGVESDRFSLAVLLFYLFMFHDPFEGRRELEEPVLDGPAEYRLYGNPVFIFDPSDRSNEPVPGQHDNAIIYWAIYPEFFRELFIRAFTEGLAANRRVPEADWRLAMIRLRDSILYCPGCEVENFWDQASTQPLQCWACGRVIDAPMRLVISDGDAAVLVLNHDSRIFPHHIDPARRLDFNKPVAEVTQHPVRQELWGLRNLGSSTWVVTTPHETVQVRPGRSATLSPGVRLNFGDVEGMVEF